MSTVDSRTLIRDLRDGCARVQAAVEGLGDDAIDYRPFADAWTIRENIVHLRDAEATSYIRHRKAIAEPGVSVDMWDEIKWHAHLVYDRTGVAPALSLYAALRESTASLLEMVPATAWSSGAIVHPQRGRMTLADVAAFFVEHDRFHIDLIERNKRLFREKKA